MSPSNPLNNSTKSADDAARLSHELLLDIDDDCASVHSLPLMNDDDFFYYRGGVADANEDNNDELVDHIGALISLSSSFKVPSKIEGEEGKLHQSLVSNLSCDDLSVGSSKPQEEDNHEKRHSDRFSIEELVSLKLKVAELESALHFECQKDTLRARIVALEEEKRSLKSENTDLKQKLKQVEQDAQEERIRTCKQMNMMARKIEILQEETLHLKESESNCNSFSGDSSRRDSGSRPNSPIRSQSTNDMDIYDDVDESELAYLPFPKKSRRRVSSKANRGSNMRRSANDVDIYQDEDEANFEFLPFPKNARRASNLIKEKDSAEEQNENSQEEDPKNENPQEEDIDNVIPELEQSTHSISEQDAESWYGPFQTVARQESTGWIDVDNILNVNKSLNKKSPHFPLLARQASPSAGWKWRGMGARAA